MNKLLAILFSMSCFSSVVLAVNNSHPNLIVILSDDMGVTDIGAFRELYPGAPEAQLAHRYTPVLDRLAREGIRCTRAYAAAWCAPSRQMLLSGQWVNRRNTYDHPWIGSQLRQEGYVTCLVGKSHGARPIAKAYRNVNPKTAEFDDGFFFNGGCRRSYLEKDETFPGRGGLVPFTFTAKGGEYLTDVYTDHAVEFIKNHADQPFMLYLPYNAPHGPLDGKPEDLRKLFPEVFAHASDQDIISGSLRAPPWNTKLAKTAKSDRLEAMHFAAMVYRMDLGIGRIMETLQEKRIDHNTLIIFTSDNARAFRYGDWLAENHPFTGHKSDMLDGGIRVPFIVWSKELTESKQSGRIYDGLVSLADIAPTLMAQATDKPYAHPTDGVDLMPYISGEQDPLKGRTWFCALAGSLDKMTGIENFTNPAYDSRIVHAALVQDEKKLLCWIPQDDNRPGAVYTCLPNVVGKTNPADLVHEETPLAGIVPVEGSGRVLYKKLTALIHSNGDALVPVWSGDVGKNSLPVSWMGLGKEPQ